MDSSKRQLLAHPCPAKANTFNVGDVGECCKTSQTQARVLAVDPERAAELIVNDFKLDSGDPKPHRLLRLL